MSLILKGIDMPKTEYEEVIIRIKHTGEVCDVHNIHLYAQAVEIPKGHGRIGDLKALEKELDKTWNVQNEIEFANKTVWRTLDNAPIILEAEE